MRRLTLPAAVTALVGLLAGCGSASVPGAPSGLRTPPNLAAFLRQPVATPSVCTTQPAAGTGRTSPWQGTVDVSVFLRRGATPRAVKQLGDTLRNAAVVQRVYFESSDEAYREFQRLYTCSASVSKAQTPASYRVVLLPTATIGQRNALVAKTLRNPAVDSASCDPALPCVDVVRSASAAAHH
jgi:hypothetical protein